MMNPLRRRFVNLVAKKCPGRVSLHRLDVSEHLFYPSTAEAEAAKPAVSSLASLPAPTFNFHPSVSTKVQNHLFALANSRSSEGRILWRSQEGHTIIYDADSNTNRSLPSGLHYMGNSPIVISIPVVRPNRVAFDSEEEEEDDEDEEVEEDGCAVAPEEEDEEDIYVMSSDRTYHTFQVLRFSNSKPLWRWKNLPPPPLPSWESTICSHAVLDGGRIICVTASPCAGTYLFDTWNHKWMQPATSNWDLPFWGACHYVPDLRLWLGVSRDDRHHLCASPDLDAAALNAASPLPTVNHLRREGLETPKGWNTLSATFLNLGDGRFCIAKILHEVVPEEDEFSSVSCVENVGKMSALLTGVEIVRSRGDRDRSSSSSEEEGFRTVVHKSLSYIFQEQRISWVI